MLNFKHKLATISIGVIIGGATLAAQHPGTSETPAAGQGATSNSTDRAALIRSFAEHDFQVRIQECNTLKHDNNPNAIGECMKTAEAQRDNMMNSQGTDTNAGGRTDNSPQTGMAGGGATGTATTGATASGGEQGGTQQKAEGVVDKVKNTVKETWADLTNKDSAQGGQAGQGGPATETTDNKDATGSIKGQHGMVLQGAGGIALFCQPITNMEPQALNR